mmetsp:Transcript_135066/g.234866  ORF Transcript_135066/g.234866 Transcript_135066/m.234866 type:complete len:240 (-) Transcript_135066:355-1074(-)
MCRLRSLLAACHAFLYDTGNHGCIIDNAISAIICNVVIVNSTAISYFVQANTPLRTAQEEIRTQKRCTDCMCNHFGHLCNDHDVLFKLFQHRLKRSIWVRVQMHNFPSIFITELTFIGWLSHHPHVPLRVCVRCSLTTPPPDSHASLSPNYHYPQLERYLITFKRLILWLHDESGPERSQCSTFIGTCLLGQEFLDVLFNDVSDSMWLLITCRWRHKDDSLNIAHMRRLHYDVMRLWSK